MPDVKHEKEESFLYDHVWSWLTEKRNESINDLHMDYLGLYTKKAFREEIEAFIRQRMVSSQTKDNLDVPYMARVYILGLCEDVGLSESEYDAIRDNETPKDYQNRISGKKIESSDDKTMDVVNYYCFRNFNYDEQSFRVGNSEITFANTDKGESKMITAKNESGMEITVSYPIGIKPDEKLQKIEEKFLSLLGENKGFDKNGNREYGSSGIDIKNQDLDILRDLIRQTVEHIETLEKSNKNPDIHFNLVYPAGHEENKVAFPTFENEEFKPRNVYPDINRTAARQNDRGKSSPLRNY